jgi:retinol dehydrogenase-12
MRLARAKRYMETKLLQILLMREMAAQLSSPSRRQTTDENLPKAVVNALTPGYCSTGLTRNVHGILSTFFLGLSAAFARKPEEGARALVDAIARGHSSHGKFLRDCKIDE